MTFLNVRELWFQSIPHLHLSLAGKRHRKVTGDLCSRRPRIFGGSDSVPSLPCCPGSIGALGRFRIGNIHSALTAQWWYGLLRSLTLLKCCTPWNLEHGITLIYFILIPRGQDYVLLFKPFTDRYSWAKCCAMAQKYQFLALRLVYQWPLKLPTSKY